MSLPGHTSRVYSAVFSPGGRLVATASEDRTAQIYACEVCGDIQELLALARKLVTRQLTADEQQNI